MKRVKSKQLAFEDYVSFFSNLDAGALSMDQLNKILSIHGLCKQKIKKDAMEDLSVVPVISPKRSTVGDRAAVYPCAPLTLEEVKADVRFVGWEECPLGSILAVGSAVEREEAVSGAHLSRPTSTTTASSSAAAARLKKPKMLKGPTRKRKRGKTAASNALVAV